MWVAESRIAQSTKARIYYETYGKGPCIVMIPGGYETHLGFYRNVPAFVKAGYQVITTNLRGHFQSPCHDGDLSFRHHPDDIEAVLDNEGIERAALMGWSMGGFGAMRLAVKRPERVAAVVLMGSTAGIYSAVNYANNDHAVRTIRGWLERGGPWLFDMNVQNATDAFLRRQLQMLHSADGFLPGPSVLVTMMMDRDVWLSQEELHTLRAPVLIVGGDLDTLLPARFQRHLVTLIPGAELGEYQDAGHNPHWENPELFNTSTLRWLAAKGW